MVETPHDGPGCGDDQDDWKGMFRNSFEGVEGRWRGKTGKRRFGIRKPTSPIDVIQLWKTIFWVNPKWFRNYMGAPSVSWSVPH